MAKYVIDESLITYKQLRRNFPRNVTRVICLIAHPRP